MNKSFIYALAWIGCLALGVLLWSHTGAARAEAIPPNAEKYMPMVVEALDDLWPTIPMRSYIPAQIEQESCISLKHKKCWNPNVELKTSREYGFGLGQFTIAYTSTGAVRFNTWQEIKDKDPSLRNWAWEDRYNPLLQIKAMVIKNRINYGKLTFNIKDNLERMAFLGATYNGGSVMKDRSICVPRNDCDSSAWFAKNGKSQYAVESFSTKSKVPYKGYGKSFFQISREYPVNILYVRRFKYIPYVGE